MSWAQGPCVAVAITTATSMSKGEKMQSSCEGKVYVPTSVVFLMLIPPQGLWLIKGAIFKEHID
jgi:hypothetical protein